MALSLIHIYGIMTAAQTAGAGDAIGLKQRNRGGKRLDARKMRAIGARARRNLGVAIDEECDIATLHQRGRRFDAVDQGALVALGQPHKHRGDIGGSQCRFKCACK